METTGQNNRERNRQNNDNEQENIFQPITLDRRDRQHNEQVNEQNDKKSDKKVLSVIMQISQSREDQVVAKEFDDILDCDNKMDLLSRQLSRQTGGQLLDESADFKDTFKNFSFSGKNKDAIKELQSPDFLLQSKKDKLRQSLIKNNFAEESFDDSSLNNRESEQLESSFQITKRLSVGNQSILFKNTSINEDQMSGFFKSSPKSTIKDKNSSGGKRNSNLSMIIKPFAMELSFKNHERNSNHMMNLQIPNQSKNKDLQPNHQVVTNNLTQKESRLSLFPEINYKEKADFRYFLQGPQEDNQGIQEQRETIGENQVAEEHHKPGHKRVYSNNYKSNFPSIDNEEQDDFDRQADAKIENEGSILNTPNRKNEKNKGLTVRNQVDNSIKMIMVNKNNMDRGDGKYIIKKSKITLNDIISTPDKPKDQLKPFAFETVVKNKQLIQNFIERSRSSKVQDRKLFQTPKLNQRKILVKQTPQPFLTKKLNDINLSLNSFSDNENAKITQNRTFDEINNHQFKIEQRNHTIKNSYPVRAPGVLQSYSQAISEDITPVNSVKDFLDIFGVDLNLDNTFNHEGKQYKINFCQKPIKIKKYERISTVQCHQNYNTIIHTLPNQQLQEEIVENFEIKARATTPVQFYNNDNKILQNSQIQDNSYEECLNHESQQTRSPHNLCPPTAKSNGQLTIPASKLQNNHLNKNINSQRSGGGGSFSGRRSDYSRNSRKSQKSEIVSSHEQMAERQRRKLRQKSQHRLNQQKDQHRLQIERQNQTDQNNINQAHMASIENIKQNMSQRQLSAFGLHNAAQDNNKIIIQQHLLQRSEQTLSGHINSLQIDSNQTAQNNSLAQNLSEYSKIHKTATQNMDQNGQPEFFDDNDTMRPRTKTTTNVNELSPEQRIHLGFLFASPLMLQISDKQNYDMMMPLPPISFSEEFEQIRDQFEEKKVSINYMYSVATQKNLKNILRESPIGLHFSGHGFQNNQKLYNGDNMIWKKNKDKGDVLIFENESGASEFFFTTDLKNMIESIKTQVSNNQLKFVYVASCHSEQVGKIFMEAGVPHVICINQNETILDKAAVEFSKAFYDEVFDKYLTVCEAYQNAKKKVEEKFGGFQAKKLILLINEKTHGEHCTKDDRFMPIKGRGHPIQVGQQTDLVFLPNKVSPFVFRNKDMYDVLQLLSEEKTFIVQIWGMPGLGKSSLLKNVTCFLAERDYYKDGVVYIDFMHVTSFQEIVQIFSFYLTDVIFEDSEIEPEYCESEDEDCLQHELKRIKSKISQFEKKILFSLDNIEHLKEGKDQSELTLFMNFIGDISSKNVKVLFSSSKYEAQLMPEDKFQVKKILKLNKKESVQLFIKKIPLGNSDKDNFLDYENIEELHQATIQKYGPDIEQRCKPCNKRHTHSQDCITKYLAEHPLFLFLAGIPLVISIVASMSVMQSLTEIFFYLADKNGKDLDKYKHKVDDDSLINCLEYCTNYLKQRDDDSALRLWYLIGTQGPGILYDDIKEIMTAASSETEEAFNNKTEEDKTPDDANQNPIIHKVDKDLNDLIQFSLIEQEILDKAGHQRRFRVSPFVDLYVNNKMEKQMKEDSLNLVCTHMNQRLKQFKKDYSDTIIQSINQVDVNHVIQKLLEQIRPYEQQILHIVSTMFKLMKSNVTIISSGELTASDLSDIEEDEIEESPMNKQRKEKDIRVSIASKTSSKSKKNKLKSKISQKEAKSSNDLIPVVSAFLRDARSSVVFKNESSSDMLQVEDQSQIAMRLTQKRDKRNNNKDLFERQQDVHPMLKPSIDGRRLTNVQEEGEEAKGEDNWSDIIVQAGHRKGQRSQFDNQRDRIPNLGFLDAKEEFMRDRNKSLFGTTDSMLNTEEDKVDKNLNLTVNNQVRQTIISGIMNDRDKAYAQRNPQDEPLGSSLTPSNRFATASARNDKDLLSDHSSEGQGPFNMFEIENQLTQNLSFNDNELDTLPFNNNMRRKMTILPPKKQEIDSQTRQSKMMKKLETLNLNSDSFNEFKTMRNTIYQKSISKGKNGLAHQLQSFKHNPDLVQNPTLPICFELEPQPQSQYKSYNTTEQSFSNIHNSAPPKNIYSFDSGKELLDMKDHEELFYNYLSILALIPEKHNDFLNILDAYGQRVKDTPNLPEQKQEEKKEWVVDLVKHAERRLRKQKTFVEIPNESRLLKANTKMLELYVTIQMNNDQSELNQRNRKKKFDRIYELADEIGKNYFERINFKRGLGMVTYIQANRQYTQFRKILDFKQLIKKSAMHFFQTHELDGIEQCLEVSEKYLKFQKGFNIDKLETNLKFIDEISRIKEQLASCDDHNVKNFVQFRQDIKTPNLSSKLVFKNIGNSASDSNANSTTSPNERGLKIQMDKVLNMLLNPQMQLRIN